MLETLLYFSVGVIATLLGSMSGLGGGFLAVPMLYYIGVMLQYAVATSKFMVFVNSIVSTYRYSQRLKMPLDLYIAVVIPMSITSYYGAYLVAILPGDILKITVSSIFVVISARMILASNKKAETSREIHGVKYLILGSISGAIAGLVAGVTGLGGGVVNVPVFIYILGLNTHLAVSLSMACMIPSSLTSVIRHIIDGVIDEKIAIPLSIGAIIGGWIGPRIALGLKKETLAKLTGLMILIASGRMIIEAILELL